jgi:hypothetical protein
MMVLLACREGRDGLLEEQRATGVRSAQGARCHRSAAGRPGGSAGLLMTATSDGPATPPGEAENSLVATVSRLRDELDGLRTAMAGRAVIEQAKGMLMERYGCDADAAFERLKRLSQHANVKLVDVAAALVEALPEPATSTALRPAGGPDPPSGGPGPPTAMPAPTPQRPTPAHAARATRRGLAEQWPRLGADDTVRAQGRRARVRTALLAARTPTEALAAAVRTALADDPPSAAVLASLDTSGVVRLLAADGVAASQAVRWQSFPVDIDLPVCRALRGGEALWLDGTQDTAPAPGTDLGLGLPEDWRRAVVLPLPDPHGSVGVLAVTWPSPAPGAAPDRGLLEAVAAGLAVVLRRLAPTAQTVTAADGASTAVPGPAGAAIALLDATMNPLLLCRPIAADDGAPADLVIVHATPATSDPASRGAAELTGRHLLELYPDAARDGLWDGCLRVMATGVQVDLPAHVWRVVLHRRPAVATVHVRITRYRDGVMITWTSGSGGQG